MDKDKEEIRAFIRNNYANVALNKGAGGCCGSGSGCGCSSNESPLEIKDISIIAGYSEEELKNVPADSNMGLGCGNPLAFAGLKEGEVVLDLGSGGGFDCFLARAEVGETGHVIGVDMTPEMIKLARKNAEESGYPNVEFRLGEIEHLPVADESVDVIISNCVINLSLDKEQVFKEVFRVLKPGGRLCVSDIVATAPLPDHIKQDLNLISSCIGGCDYVEDLKVKLINAGFKAIQMIPKDNSRELLKTWAPSQSIEDFIASYIINAAKASLD
ncbi:MAG: arsenite methyltransferase [Syntrophomonadaceae bacterium]|jgi:ubiquinone/menaquinone biosynthesis C-methylase UbiE|nr:arsenite methyltransferase [Syntrophomonadaceae bacterium]